MTTDKDSAHSVIGQEYDKVVAVIDDNFAYHTNGELYANAKYSGYYSQHRMLYQILSRTRKSLYLVVINNEDVLNKCLEILQPQI